MARDGDQGTDAQPIKPVSSLLSHFEGLKTQTPQTRLSDRSPLAVRASFELPRPESPWTVTTDPARVRPHTPGQAQRKDTDSPTKSGHKRPMSMHISSSPKLTPAVNVESPKSPPRSFFGRNGSRSPERVDNTPFGKVRDLISAHSSRSSSRPPSPERKSSVDSTKIRPEPLISTRRQSDGRSISPARPPPPPINRAEKPKIPAKQLKVASILPVAASAPTAERLAPEPATTAASTEPPISPFNTPPSSDGMPSPEEKAQPVFSSEPQDILRENDSLRPRDPRSMGFNATSMPTRANTVGERRVLRDNTSPKRHVSAQVNSAPPPPPQSRDARHMGLSSVNKREEKPKHEPVQISPPPPSQNASQTRDPRQLGFSNTSTREQRTMAEQTPTLPPQVPTNSASLRDSRQFGFSNSDAREGRPELPTRRIAMAPPPRPSQESKNLPPRKPSPQADMSEKPRQPSIPSLPKSVTPAPADVRFPPPPKRNNFNGEGTAAQSISKPEANADYQFSQGDQGYADDSDEAEKTQEPQSMRTDYPDATQSNRRPPFNMSSNIEIRTKSDGRVFDVCGRYLCVSGYVTRVFDMSTGEQVLGLNHGETVKISSVRFKPNANINSEGTRLWIGSNIGDLQEVDIETSSVIATSLSHNRRDVIRILRHRKNLWTLDDDGKLFVWPADETGEPNLKYSHISHKTPRGHTFSMVVNDELWLATGKEIRIYRPGKEAAFTPLTSPLSQSNAGDVTSGTYSTERGGHVYLGHIDGKISMYSTKNYSCMGVIKVSDYKMNSLCFVGDRLWAAYKTGKVYVYDTSCTPWKVKKDWNAHAGPVSGMLLDPSSVWTMSNLQIVTTGHDDVARLWDATLEEDWMESAMQERGVEYCTFRELKAAVITWNVGASVPGYIRDDFIADAIHSEDPPDILVFGFQEVVDLEDKAMTAKSILGFAKKKDTAKTEQHQSRIYREWRDYLARCIDRFTSAQYRYSELQTSSLIGLFQCIFIRHEERHNVTSLAATNVKCGMGGHYGNKGALVTRFALDDSSLCFINCHLAAGQSQTSHRNNDVATILESESLPVESNRQLRSSMFIGGGDGSQILDHEICILNGDLNYRIDTVPRDTVIKMIRNGELPKLMERDQLMICRRRIAGFRLSPFAELPITFEPTYKYDVGTNNYDSSEKKRSPAWCDRILYRGPGRVKQLEYRRHEVRVSDHRPVSGIFKIKVKKVDSRKREKVRDECFKQFQGAKKQICERACVGWLVEVMGVPEAKARQLIAG